MSKAEKPFILVVDDNAETCTLLTALFRRDFVVDLASEGNEAVEKIRTRRYVCILLDLRMPQHDGFSVLEFLKKSQPEALRKVIVLTALVSARDLERARSYNVCDVIAKPFDVETLLAAVRDCAGGDSGNMTGFFCSPVILLLADLIRQKLS